jgi:hypothetical protein
LSGEKLAAFLVLKKTGYSKTLLSVESVESYWALERAGSHSPFSRLLQHFLLLQPWLFSLPSSNISHCATDAGPAGLTVFVAVGQN